MKKFIVVVLSLCLVLAMAACAQESPAPATTPEPGSTTTPAAEPAATLDFPKYDLQGSIMWSAGGVCDTVSRAIAPYVEPELGAKVVYTNRPGAAGGISTAYVTEQPADGYNLLFGAENPQIAKVMGTSQIDYDDFIPINIFCTSVGIVMVNKNSEYETFNDLVEDMIAKNGKLNMAATGAGGLPFTIASMIKAVNGAEANQVVFDGENGCITALMGGHVDFAITTLGSAMEFCRSGEVKPLAVFHTEPIEGLENVPLVIDCYEGYNDYLPWGPFYGVLVKKGTPDDVVAFLTEAFSKAADRPEFKEMLVSLGSIPFNASGQQAIDYLDSYRSVSSWLLYDVGATEFSPEDFGIPRP